MLDDFPHMKDMATRKGSLTLGSVPDGFVAPLLIHLARARAASSRQGRRQAIIHIASDAKRLDALLHALRFFAPAMPIIAFPAWDCLPYDRSAPDAALGAARMAALATLLQMNSQIGDGGGKGKNINPNTEPYIVLTTANAITQRVPARAMVKQQCFSAEIGQKIERTDFIHFLIETGYSQSALVTTQGQFAIRGGIIDLFPPGAAQPVRLDFFGDRLETIRIFEAETQQTIGQCKTLLLHAASEIRLDKAAIARFRKNYIATFGSPNRHNAAPDLLYEAVKAGNRYAGMEHWLPLFHAKLETLLDYVPDGLLVLDHLAQNAIGERYSQLHDYYQARCDMLKLESEKRTKTNLIKPLPPDMLYLGEDEWQTLLATRDVRPVSPFAAEEKAESLSLQVKPAYNFAAERAQDNINLFDALIDHIKTLQKQGKRVIIVSRNHDARARLAMLLDEHGLTDIKQADDWPTVLQSKEVSQVYLCVLALETGFETDALAVIAEQDVFGDRLHQRKRSKKAAHFLAEAASLMPGDLVVHVDHGIAQFDGLETITTSEARHDCLKLVYYGGDRLFLPVENIDLVSRYGGNPTAHVITGMATETGGRAGHEAEINATEENPVEKRTGGVTLDRLGSANWQMRKARVKNRLRDIADELIRVAAARMTRQGKIFSVADNLYNEFCARFPFDETDDQAESITAIIADLASGRPMDRLVCGDVGFGKTEIALRAAFIVAMSGAQTALIVPTTLLARQHVQTFRERFAGLPIKIAELSRLVSTKQANETKIGMAEGSVDIVIGTHALLQKNISFANPGLVIIDEEQHFGVQHKEGLKKLYPELHVLTLTATPIPRTLQLALADVRDLSLITTPPIDRLAVRTYVTPFDQLIIREALLREKYRTGQSFFICPHIADLDEAAAFLRTYVPEVKFVITHGQMAGRELEARITAFYDGQYDVLLSTSIIESGLDIPTANTIIITRADMFGLARLYQMRGRVGRAKLRAYAYLTYEDGKPLSTAVEKRLQVLQSLDHLGAGFTLASYDLDLRGAGNLLGAEQSGHVREVGFELYQSMLEEAVAKQQEAGRQGDKQQDGTERDEAWSPQINIGMSVLLPDDYITDFEVRMGLYRRMAHLETEQDIENFAAELVDRFGSLPQPALNLLQIIAIKQLCRLANVEKLDVGAKGAVLSFRKQTFANPAGLAEFIATYQENTTQRKTHGIVKLRPDHALVFKAKWDSDKTRLANIKRITSELARINGQKPPVAQA